ncbi:hypothetical protein GUJ93_ZPchr0002g24317 [Zizania palustris]|uniref:Uncharacterized protein n=1 Tax=Zizania palustris TaxID=103762 RepID=A0A8J5S6L4_ZIZPA|nr:hypothetical protein GUJ93_ZPchr0002g24317 [Zizania palustris]
MEETFTLSLLLPCPIIVRSDVHLSYVPIYVSLQRHVDRRILKFPTFWTQLIVWRELGPRCCDLVRRRQHRRSPEQAADVDTSANPSDDQATGGNHRSFFRESETRGMLPGQIDYMF